MKVLYLLDSLKRGGIEILALDVFRNAANCDLPALFVATGGGELEKEFQTGAAEFIRLRRRLPIDANIILKLRKIIKQRRITLVHTFQAVEATHAFLAAMGTQAKVVLSHHGFVADKKNLYALRFLIPRVAVNVFVTRGLQNWYSSELNFPVSEAKSKIIYNGTDAKRLVWRGESLRKELNLPQDAALVGTVANFYREPRKDHLTVCKSLPRVFAENPNAFCVFVGGVKRGAESKFSECVNFCRENRIEARVFFLGSRSDAAKIFASLDVFVLSSLHEGFGIVVAEAMLSKVSCVVSEIEPLLEVSQNGKYAETFPVGNEEVLSRKITNLLKDKSTREDLSERAFAFAKKNYGIETHIENLKTLYANLI